MTHTTQKSSNSNTHSPKLCPHSSSPIEGWNFHYWHKPTTRYRPIIALHGFTGNGLDFAYFGQHAISNCNWIAPDLPGHGKTQLNADNVFSLASFVDTFIDVSNLMLQFQASIAMEHAALNSKKKHSQSQILTHNDYNRPILLGYSMGGRLALALALTYPNLFSKLILVSTRPGYHSHAEHIARIESDRKWIDILQLQGVEGFYNKWENQPIIASQNKIDPQERKKMRQRRIELNTVPGLIFALETFGSGIMPPFWNNLHRITIPTLLISGENDTEYSQKIHKEMTSVLPKNLTQEAIIPNAGHAPQWENRDAFVEVIENYLTM